ncbi:MAG: DUF4349 domain-containing protein [Bacteroidota bacterium]
MKRRVIVVAGIVAFVCFVLYQFIFADHRSRSKVDLSKTESVYSLVEEAPEPLAKEAPELGMLAQTSSFNESSVQRKLIKEGVVEFQVDDVAATSRSITTLIKQFNAYVASDREENYAGGPQHRTVVRIPSDKLEDFILKIEPLAKTMKSKRTSSNDVTDEYIDLTERVVTKRNLEKNYRAILLKATKVSEMLEVEGKLEEVRGDIESMQARVDYINSQVSYSTLTITYYQVITTTDTDEPTFTAKIANSLASGWLSILDFIVDLLYAWPLLIVLPLAAWFGIRLFKRFKHILT